MRKLSEYNFTDVQMREFYEANRGPINSFYGEDKDADLLSRPYATTLVKSELKRLQDFKEVYPYLMNFLREGFQPSIDYVLDNEDEYPFFNEDGYMKSNMCTVLEAARTNVGLLKWLPDHYRNDPTVLLTAYFSNRSSFMGLAAYMDPGAFKFITEDLWDGNYYKGQEHDALEELIRLVKQSEDTNFLLQFPQLSEERYRLILNFIEEQLQRPFTDEELQIFKSFRTHDPITQDSKFKDHVNKIFGNNE